jgi:hypothetical protein
MILNGPEVAAPEEPEFPAELLVVADEPGLPEEPQAAAINETTAAAATAEMSLLDEYIW